MFPHSPNSTVNLYASVPYLTGHGLKRDASVAWMNSADTWVHLIPRVNNETNGTFASFVSESGSLEFFSFASSKGPAKV